MALRYMDVIRIDVAAFAVVRGAGVLCSHTCCGSSSSNHCSSVLAGVPQGQLWQRAWAAQVAVVRHAVLLHVLALQALSAEMV